MLQPDLNIKGINAYTREVMMKGNYNPFPYDGIWLFTGAQGSGKTLMLMHAVHQIHEEYPEALIVSNISIFGIPCMPYTGIECFEKYNNGEKGILFIIDEIHTLYNSLESAKMPPSTLSIWSQNRKNRRVILGTSQRFNRVAKGIREQTKYNYECRRPIFCFYGYRIIEADMYDDNGKFIGEKPPLWSWYVPKVSVMRMYNTLEVVRPPEEEKTK